MAMEASDHFPIEIPMGNLELSEGNWSMVLVSPVPGVPLCFMQWESPDFDMWSAPKSIETQ